MADNYDLSKRTTSGSLPVGSDSSVQITVTSHDDFHVSDSGVETEAESPPLGSKDADRSPGLPEHNGSRPILHPAYEKKPTPGLKAGGRSSPHPQHKFLSPNAAMSDSDLGDSIDSAGGGRKGSLIDQIIPKIRQDSMDNYFDPHSDRVSILERDEDNAAKCARLRAPRLSIFSIYSHTSTRSDESFWDPQESIPSANHYEFPATQPETLGGRTRPTLYQLREEPETPTRPTSAIGTDLDDNATEEPQVKKKKPKVRQKLGWIQGVLVRCILNIFGVMLFLRMTWMTGQAGIGLFSIIILISTVVEVLTVMSMSAICTNGEVRGGGAYYMTSRSLGPEWGGAIGIVFSLANAVSVALNVVGFAESVRDIIHGQGSNFTGDLTNDVRAIGCLTNLLILGIAMIGLDFESATQQVLMVILGVALANYFVGTFIPPSESKRRVGFVGYRGFLISQNFGPDYRVQDGTMQDFFSIFNIFFPSATGILAGANISGDLKNPSVDIPKGSFLGIFITSTIYLGVVWTCGGSMVRDAVGATTDFPSNISMSIEEIQTCINGTCEYGLENSYDIMGVSCGYQPIIYAGIFAASISSALACFVSAPKVFQALGRDHLFPGIGFFAVGSGKGDDPRRGYFLTFVLSVGVTCIGSLDAIAPIISNFFLMSFMMINYACFEAALVKSPGFRPSYRFFNKWLSLLGALMCLVIMFLLMWWAALATVIVCAALFLYMKYKKPDVNWGSSGQARVYNEALKSTLRLVNVGEHVKNYRPQMLVLTGYPRNRPALVDLASTITKRQCLLICAHVLQGDMHEHLAHLRSTSVHRWFYNRHVRAFYTSMAAPRVRLGVQALLQSQGLGKLRPNVLLMGFKSKWQTISEKEVHDYVGIIHDAFDLQYGVGVLRLTGGLDAQKVDDDLLDVTKETLEDLEFSSSDEDEHKADGRFKRWSRKTKTSHNKRPNSIGPGTASVENGVVLTTFRHNQTDGYVNNGFTMTDETKQRDQKKFEIDLDDDYIEDTDDERRERDADATPDVPQNILAKYERQSDPMLSNKFRGKQTGNIDVWWLFDDGGLGLLIPHILSTRKRWRECNLRIFCAGTKKANMENDRKEMASLLHRFRIEYSEIIVVPDLSSKPRRSSYKEFEHVIYNWRLKADESQEDYPWKISDEDVMTQKQKIYMQLKIREKLKEHSSDASLIVVTLPVPKKFCPAGLYMAYMDTLTRDLPPTLLLRGNQESVLTYLS